MSINGSVFTNELSEHSANSFTELRTNMFIDTHDLPQYRMRITRYNDFRNASNDIIDAIPCVYPPKYHRYVDGTQYFLVRRRDDGYLMAVFNRQHVRDRIFRDPKGWEDFGIFVNMGIDEWRASERSWENQGGFWLHYLPFLDHFSYTHDRINYGLDFHIYNLSNACGTVLFECDIQECIDYWSNVRIDQWSYDTQEQVRAFLQCAQQPEGWTNVWQRRQPPPQPQPPQPQPPRSPSYQPPSPGGHIDTTMGDSSAPGEPRDIPDDASSTSTRVGGPDDNEDNESGSSGFDSDLESILLHEHPVIHISQLESVSVPGTDDGRNESDDDEYEWRVRAYSPNASSGRRTTATASSDGQPSSPFVRELTNGGMPVWSNYDFGESTGYEYADDEGVLTSEEAWDPQPGPSKQTIRDIAGYYSDEEYDPYSRVTTPDIYGTYEEWD